MSANMIETAVHYEAIAIDRMLADASRYLADIDRHFSRADIEIARRQIASAIRLIDQSASNARTITDLTRPDLR